MNDNALPRRPSTLWPKGVSGNPGGRPKSVALVADLARTHTPQAIATLAEIMNDKKATRISRIAAANALLDRAWGKPPQSVGLTVDDGIGALPIPDWEVARRIAFTLAHGLALQNRTITPALETVAEVATSTNTRDSHDALDLNVDP